MIFTHTMAVTLLVTGGLSLYLVVGAALDLMRPKRPPPL